MRQRRKKMENKMLCEDSTMDDICCYVDFFNWFTITCLCIHNIKKENYSSSGIVHNLVLYFGLIIMYELLVILFENALYFFVKL